MFLPMHRSAESVTIVGGGLAGLTLGIGLRQRGVPVVVWEAGHLPRHRVCGEFISGTGQRALDRLGLLDRFRATGACSAAAKVTFFTETTRIAARTLPEPALCISRLTLDDWLAQEFQKLGGELRFGARWTGPCGGGVVRASGRRAAQEARGWRLFGLKAHARNVELEGDLEMHLLPLGYVGLCRLAGGEVNVCGLFRTDTKLPNLARNWRGWLGGPEGSMLRSRLKDARFDEGSFCAVTALSLRPMSATDRSECCVGEALTMIPPVTGNGMSMAFESAELAIEPLVGFSRGDLNWEEARRTIAASCDRRFAARLRHASWLQWGLFHPIGRAILGSLVARSNSFWVGAFQATR